MLYAIFYITVCTDTHTHRETPPQRVLAQNNPEPRSVTCYTQLVSRPRHTWEIGIQLVHWGSCRFPPTNQLFHINLITWVSDHLRRRPYCRRPCSAPLSADTWPQGSDRPFLDSRELQGGCILFFFFLGPLCVLIVQLSITFENTWWF